MMVQTAIAQQPKWGIHNSIVDYQHLTTSSLPTSPTPDYTQNALWDFNGNRVLYEADGVIYDKTGGVVLDMSLEANVLYHPYFSYGSHILAGFTEFIFVPVPGECGKFYGITTYSNGADLIPGQFNLVADIVWCKLDITSTPVQAEVIGPVGLKLRKENTVCEYRAPNSPRIPITKDFYMHIEITKELPNGKRYLFCANTTCVSVYAVTSTGISNITDYNMGGRTAIENLRSEMEVYQKDMEFEVAIPNYKVVGTYNYPELLILNFDMSLTTPQVTEYSIDIPDDPDRFQIIKGLEFSEDGKSLYATVMTVKPTIKGNKVPGKNIVYFERSGLGSSFQYGGIISSGNYSSDFAQGMIEKGIDGKIWIAGFGRLATIADNNNPNSLFTVSAISFTNGLSGAPLYEENNTPSSYDIERREMFLLMDQIDGEDVSSWQTTVDNYPPTIVGCPPTVISLPPNSTAIFYPNNGGQPITGAPPRMLVFDNGTLLITYFSGTECETVERVSYVEDGPYCDADFTYRINPFSTTSGTGSASVSVQGVCNLTYPDVLDIYLLYEWDNVNSGWAFVDACGGNACTLLALSNGHTYKIDHVILNYNSVCNPHALETKIFNW